MVGRDPLRHVISLPQYLEAAELKSNIAYSGYLESIYAGLWGSKTTLLLHINILFLNTIIIKNFQNRIFLGYFVL